MNVNRKKGLPLLLFSEVAGMHGECFSRANHRCSISAFLPDCHPLISKMDLHDDELSSEFSREFDVAIEHFDSVLFVSIFAHDAEKEEKRLAQIREIGNALQRGGRHTGLRPPKGRSPAVVDSTSSIELLEFLIDLGKRREAVSFPKLPIKDRVRSFDGTRVPWTPRRIEDHHYAVVTPPTYVASDHSLLIDGTAEAGAVVLLDDIGERQSQSEEHDGEDAQGLGGCRGLNAKEELLLLRMNEAKTQEVNRCFISFDVSGTDEVHLHHLLSDRSEKADRVEHVLGSPLLFLAMRLGAPV